jgi:hypothetical protein
LEETGPIVLEGQFMEDELHGFGKITVIKEDTVYEGEFSNGNKQGWGIMTWADNT